jgi:predicted ribonuclease YlaK
MKYLFLDTNIFLHFRYYTEINWNQIIGDGEYTIVVTSMVIDELDNKKYDVNRKISKRAKQMLIRFLEISNESQRENFPVVIDSTRPKEITFIENNLKNSTQDDNILASIIEFDIGEMDEKYLISNDTGPKLKAKSLNIKAPNISEIFLLEVEIDETEKELKNLKREFTEFKNTIPKVTLTFDNSEEFLKCNLKNQTISKIH